MKNIFSISGLMGTIHSMDKIVSYNSKDVEIYIESILIRGGENTIIRARYTLKDHPVASIIKTFTEDEFQEWLDDLSKLNLLEHMPRKGIPITSNNHIVFGQLKKYFKTKEHILAV